jgi:hypothetical protein
VQARLNVRVFVNTPVDWLPEVDLEPDHAPEAEQEIAFVEDQVMVEVPPLATDVGFAASDTVGTGGGVEPPWLLWTVSRPVGATSPLPQPANAKASTGTSSSVLIRKTGILIR